MEEKAVCKLSLIDNDGYTFSFLLTLSELQKLAFMPYKLVGSGHIGRASHVRLEQAKIDAYRHGEKFYIHYDTDSDMEHCGTVQPNQNYSNIEKILIPAVNNLLSGKSEYEAVHI